MSSSSQSSGRRSSSRRRSSRSKSKRGLAKTAAQNGANFWVMLGGFVFGLTLLLLLVSFFVEPGIDPELLAANDENRADVVTHTEKKNFNAFLENATVEQLASALKSLQTKKEFPDETSFNLNSQRQQKIIDRMLDKPLSDEHRQFTVLANIKNTVTKFWHDQANPVSAANLAIRLREVTEMHAEDSDPLVAFESRVELARLNSLDPTDRAVDHGRDLYNLLSDFPENKRVHNTITNAMKTMMVNAEDRPTMVKVLGHFLKQPKVPGNKETEELYLLLVDLSNLADLGFFESFENVKYTGKAGRDQLRDVCLDLSETQYLGNYVIRHLVNSAQWMEVNGHYDHAIEIFNAIVKSGSRLANPYDVERFRRYGAWGVKRCEAVGKPFSLATSLYDGKPLRLSGFESMPVLIVFWSRSDDSEKILYQIEEASKRWRRNSVQIIAVQVERDALKFDQELTRQKAEQFERWAFCYDDGSGTGPIFSQIPRSSNGRIALLDRQHELFDVNVDMEELVTAVNSVLATRSVQTQE